MYDYVTKKMHVPVLEMHTQKSSITIQHTHTSLSSFAPLHPKIHSITKTKSEARLLHCFFSIASSMISFLEDALIFPRCTSNQWKCVRAVDSNLSWGEIAFSKTIFSSQTRLNWLVTRGDNPMGIATPTTFSESNRRSWKGRTPNSSGSWMVPAFASWESRALAAVATITTCSGGFLVGNNLGVLLPP